jgi:AcrR family transcriptional regulator
MPQPRFFVEKGYAAASISQIAAVAGVCDGLIHRYFYDKRALLDSVLSEYFAKIIAKLERAAASDAPFPEKVRSLISQHLRSFLEDLDFCRFFVSDVRSANNYRDSPVKKLNRAYTRIFIKVLAEGIAVGEMKADLDADYRDHTERRRVRSALAKARCPSFAERRHSLAEVRGLCELNKASGLGVELIVEGPVRCLPDETLQ